MYFWNAQDFSNTAPEQPVVTEFETCCSKATCSLLTHTDIFQQINSPHWAEQAVQANVKQGKDAAIAVGLLLTATPQHK